MNHHEEREEHEGKEFDSGIQTGLMFNLNVTKLKDGIKRYVL